MIFVELQGSCERRPNRARRAGYFTSRPTSKGFIREGTAFLQAARQLELLAPPAVPDPDRAGGAAAPGTDALEAAVAAAAPRRHHRHREAARGQRLPPPPGPGCARAVSCRAARAPAACGGRERRISAAEAAWQAARHCFSLVCQTRCAASCRLRAEERLAFRQQLPACQSRTVRCTCRASHLHSSP